MALMRRSTRKLQGLGIDLQVRKGMYGYSLYDPTLCKQKSVVYNTIRETIAAAISGERPQPQN